MRAWAILVVLALAGCAGPGSDDPAPDGGNGVVTTPTTIGPPLVFGGVVRDATTGALLANATVRIDLAQHQPCERQGIGWASWEPAIANGTWGPFEVPRPRSDDVAFFVHAMAPGYTTNDKFIGAVAARGDIQHTTIVLHPDAEIVGTAPPGTLVALDTPRFPRVELASANGTFRFAKARVAEAAFVAATDDPFHSRVAAPANVTVPAAQARGWLLEGIVKGPTGAPLAADVVAWNGTALWSVARAGESGAFAMPLAAAPASLLLHARTADGHFGGVLSLEINGPPALRETILAKALC